MCISLDERMNMVAPYVASMAAPRGQRVPFIDEIKQLELL